MLPLVSIIIPVYNGSNYVEDAIISCLQQTYSNFEIIVVNDGSTDSTESICLKYKDKIRYFYKENGGVSSALNLGISNSRGEFISWLSHDDYYLPNKLEDEVKTSLQCNGSCIVFSNYKIVNSKRRVVQKINFCKEIDLSNYPQYVMIFACLMNGCGLLISKSLFEKHGLFDVKLKYTQDYKKWFEFIDEEFIYNNKYVMCSRRHPEQGTQLFLTNNIELDNLWNMMIHWLFEKKLYSRFLGYNESIYFFRDAFKFNKSMTKTMSYINNLADYNAGNKITKNISNRIYNFEKNNNPLNKVFMYWKIFGFRKLCSKMLSVVFYKK